MDPKVLQKQVPSKYTSTRYSQSWCNRTIRRMSRRKRRAYRKARRTNNDKDWAHFKSLQKTNKKECKKAHNNYVNTMVIDGGNKKKLYSFVKNKKCDSSGVVLLKKDGNTVGDARGKAEVLNSQFSSVFTEEVDSPIRNLGTSSYIKLFDENHEIKKLNITLIRRHVKMISTCLSNSFDPMLNSLCRPLL